MVFQCTLRLHPNTTRRLFLPNPKIAEHHHPRCAPLSGTSRCSARQFWLAEHRIRPYSDLRGTLTCSANFGLRTDTYSQQLRGFRQNAAREGRSYAPGWGLRCAKCRYRPVAHRDHRHIAQEDASCTLVRRRAATGLPARQGFPVGLRAPQWHIAMLRAARLPGWFARRSRRSTYGQKKPRKNTPSVPQVDLRAHSGDEQVVARKISKISEQLLYL